MILGKFMPPHDGHQYLIEFGRQYCDRLVVLVCSLPDDPISGRLRHRWVREMFPWVDVIHIAEVLPQEPSEHPDFWPIWKRVVEEAVQERIDYVFASEAYGTPLAEVLGAKFVPVDPGRELVGVSGTAVRADPLGHWGLLPRPVRTHYLKRVCIIGPESTGKSTLARDLAAAFNTLYVHEYARNLLSPKAGVCEADDIERIVRGQTAAEDALASQANRVLFCDTDVLTTMIWSEVLFGSCPRWVGDLADRRAYDLYLLTDIDAPWVDDGERYLGKTGQRSDFFNRCRRALDERQRPYRIIRGDWNARFAAAVEAVQELLRTRANQ